MQGCGVHRRVCLSPPTAEFWRASSDSLLARVAHACCKEAEQLRAVQSMLRASATEMLQSTV